MEPKRQQQSDGGFRTYIEELNRLEKAQRSDRIDPLKILGMLRESGPIPVPELMVKSGLGFTEFAATLKTMLDTGLISLTGPSGQEVVEITQNGSQLVQLAS
jgi:predicted transcriptional regulator